MSHTASQGPSFCGKTANWRFLVLPRYILVLHRPRAMGVLLRTQCIMKRLEPHPLNPEPSVQQEARASPYLQYNYIMIDSNVKHTS